MEKKTELFKTLKIVARTVFVVIFAGTLIFTIYTLRNNTGEKSHTVSEVIEVNDSPADHDTAIVQDNVPYPVYVDYGDVILGAAERESDLRIMTRPVQIADVISKDGLFNWTEVFGQSQVVVYHAEVDYFVDLSGLDDSDINVDEREHVIRITIPYPEYEIRPIFDEYEFFDPSNGLLRFGSLTLTPEMHTEIESDAMDKLADYVEDDEESWETAEEYARLAVEDLFQVAINAQETATIEAEGSNAQFVYYDVVVMFG